LSILAPGAALVLWSLIVLAWMIMSRIPALRKAGIKANQLGAARGVEIDPFVPVTAAWRSHNYSHLMEQPTLFYATIIFLALTGSDTLVNVALAWSYVVLRVVHSIWQGTVNVVPVRTALFVMSTFCLIFLATNALRVTLGAV
jgi:hypothetical protein